MHCIKATGNHRIAKPFAPEWSHYLVTRRNMSNLQDFGTEGEEGDMTTW